MRITHVIRSDGFAGVERHVAALAATQSGLGHQVHVIGGDQNLVPARIGRDVVLHTPARTVLQVVMALRRPPVPNILNVHMTAAEIGASLSFQMRGVPIVSTRHFAAPRGSRLISRAAVLWAARRVSSQISVSHHVARHIDGESTVVYPGVHPGLDGLPAEQRDPVILVAQRLESEKQPEVAIAAFAASGLGRSGWSLDVAGTGSLLPSLERQVRSLGLSHAVRFLGHCPDIESRMATAAVLLAPSANEGFGLSVIEAMAAGLPVVAAGAGGHLETVGSVRGAALFPAGDTRRGGLMLADITADLGAREQYGRALQAAQRARFTLDAQAEATQAVYAGVL